MIKTIGNDGVIDFIFTREVTALPQNYTQDLMNSGINLKISELGQSSQIRDWTVLKADRAGFKV